MKFKKIWVLAGLLGAAFGAWSTVLNPNNSVTYACSSATSTFQVSFPYQQQQDLVVTATTAVPATTTLTLGTDYTLNLVSTTTTATLTLLNPTGVCPGASSLKITRSLALTQPQSFLTQGAFYPALHEKAFDRLAMQVQQLSNAGVQGATGATGPSGPTGAVGAANWSLATLPLAPDSRSEEFNETPAYACPGTVTCSPASGNPINVMANPLSGNPNLDLGNQRPGWLLMQSVSAGSPFAVIRPSGSVTFNTNDIMWARLTSSYALEGSTNEHTGQLCMIVTDTPGTHSAGLCLNSNGGTYAAGPTPSNRSIGSFTVASPSTFNILGQGAYYQTETSAFIPQYFAIVKTGSIYTMWMAIGENGAWSLLGTSTTQSWTPTGWLLTYKSTCIAAPCAVGDWGAVDFVRFQSGNLLP